MKCKECELLNLSSHVMVVCSMTTSMHCDPFYDNDGKYHFHDLNINTIDYECNNGHSFKEKTSGFCWCGWNNNLVIK